MPWSDYGFNGANGLDMALMPIDLTLEGLIKAAKERLDAVGVSDSYYTNLASGYYRLWPDNNEGGRYEYMRCNRVRGVDQMISSALAASNLDASFVSSDSSVLPVFDYQAGHGTYQYDEGYVLDTACAKLAGKGYQTVAVPFFANSELLPYDKNWLIQRKMIADMLRYYYVSYPDVNLIPLNASNLGDIIYKYRENDLNSYYSTFNEALANSQTKYGDLAGYGDNVLGVFHFSYYNGQNNIRFLLEELYVSKDTIDSIGSHNVRLKARQYSETDGVMPIVNMRKYIDILLIPIDFNNQVYLQQFDKTYYKIQFPLSPSDIIDYVTPYWGADDTMSSSLYYFGHPVAVYDGADTFDLLDIEQEEEQEEED